MQCVGAETGTQPSVQCSGTEPITAEGVGKESESHATDARRTLLMCSCSFFFMESVHVPCL